MTRAGTHPTAALGALHVAVALFGFAALFGQWIALPAVAIVLGRTIVAAATLALVLLATRERFGRPGMALFVNGALLALHWVAFFAAVQAASVAVALFGYATFPAFVMLIEWMTRRRAMSRVDVVTVAAVALGVALLFPLDAWSRNAIVGLAWGVASGLTFALLTLRNRSLVAVRSPVALALWQNAFAAVSLVPFVLAMHPLVPNARDLALIAVLGVGCTALAHSLFIASMKRVSAHAASVVSLLEPVYGIALAATLLGQWPDTRTLVGGVIIVGAALVATRASLRRVDRMPLA